MANNSNYFKVILVFNTRTDATLFRFTCVQCVNRNYCRRHFDGVLKCPVENGLNSDKDIKTSHCAYTFGGNQYFIERDRTTEEAIMRILSQYTR